MAQQENKIQKIHSYNWHILLSVDHVKHKDAQEVRSGPGLGDSKVTVRV